MIQWSRRRFVQSAGQLGLVATGAALLAENQGQPVYAQSIGAPPRIGFLTAATPGQGGTIPAFLEGLRALGWVEGETLDIDWRYAEGHEERLPALAADLARLPLAVIVAAGGNPAVQAAQDATGTIPIVMTNASDPVAAGFVTSLERPGGNLTGVLSILTQLSLQRVALLREAFPGAVQVAVLWNPTNSAAAQSYRETEAAAGGLRLQPLPVRALDDFAGAFGATTRDGAEALLVLQDPLLLSERARLIEFAASTRLPAMYPDRPFVADGGLLAVGQSGPSLFRRAAIYVDQILRGASPGDLPIVQPQEAGVYVNLKTAQALGLTVPPSVVVQGTEVLQ
jgi:putative ABC transport system substrate-binding protein